MAADDTRRADPGEDPERRPTILIVDDHPDTLVALRAIFADGVYRIVTAGSGEEALKAVLREGPSLILLDVVMPAMSGFDVAEILKGRERSSRIPIIFLTGSGAGAEPLRRAYSVGAVDYLEKPVSPEVVRAKTASLVRLYLQGEAGRAEASRERLARATERTQSERRYRNLAEAVPAIVWTASPDGALAYVNERFEQATGVAGGAARGDGWREALHEDDRPRFTRQWREAVASGRPFEAEARLRARDGAAPWYLWRAVPERGESGTIVAWLGTATEIESQKRAQAELERAVALREEFLSVASHELKTPVAALRLQLQSLVRSIALHGTPSREELLDKLGRTDRLIQRQVDFVEQLLDVTRIGQGRLELNLEPTDLAAIVRDVATRLEEDARRAATPLLVDAPGPVIGAWDPLRVEQVAENLLSNALKYGRGHPIQVRVEDRGGDGTARLVITDHGIGIDAADQRRIFERFERAVPASSYGGLGLGLWIAREIVEAHRGAIEVESAPGDGATFVVELPKASALAAARDGTP